MSEMKQYQYKRLESPLGEAIYPWLHKPDTKYNADGVYKTKLKIPLSEELTAFIDTIQEELDVHYEAAVAEAKAAGKRPPKKYELNYYEDDEYGYLNLKCNAKIKLKDGTVVEKKFPILSAEGDRFDGVRYVNNGSKLKAVVDLVPMNSGVAGAGVSLRLICVKVSEFAKLPPLADKEPSFSDDGEEPF